MSVLTTHRFSVEEYHKMAETGLLEPEARVELLDGQIIDMMPIGPFHAGTTYRLTKSFINLGEGRWHTGIQTPIRLGRNSEPVPDLTLLKPAADDYTSRHPGPEEVFLLVEVADSTLTYDRSQKLPAYGKAGIPEVWIVNLPERSVEIYREPHYLGYSSKMIIREDEQACLQAFPDVAINVKSLLRQATT